MPPLVIPIHIAHRRSRGDFFLERVKGEFKIAWVKLMDVCKPKKFGGFGIRDLRLVDLTLLDKWRRRLFSKAFDIWRDILTAKYEATYMTSILGEITDCLWSTSPWWEGVSLLGAKADDTSDWFRIDLSFKVGSGLLTSFKENLWVGNTPLRLRFSIFFFSISIQTSNSVGKVGIWEGYKWTWDLKWRRPFLFD